jgi:hypothetical protein
MATLRFSPVGVSVGLGFKVLLITGLVSMGCTLSWGMVAHAANENAMQKAINAANNLFMFEWVLLLNMLLC